MADENTPGQEPGAEKKLCPRAGSNAGPQWVEADPAKNVTAEAKEMFIAALAARANIRMAAEAGGFTPSAFHRHRGKDPAFARAWDDAKAEGVERIEMEFIRLAEEALLGESPPPSKEAEEKAALLPPLTFDQAMAVVRLFRGRDANANGSRARRHWHWMPMDPEKAKEIILRNVEAVRRAAMGKGDEGEALA